jgi:hypothetical protein
MLVLESCLGGEVVKNKKKHCGTCLQINILGKFKLHANTTFLLL